MGFKSDKQRKGFFANQGSNSRGGSLATSEVRNKTNNSNSKFKVVKNKDIKRTQVSKDVNDIIEGAVISGKSKEQITKEILSDKDLKKNLTARDISRVYDESKKINEKVLELSSLNAFKNEKEAIKYYEFILKNNSESSVYPKKLIDFHKKLINGLKDGSIKINSK